MNSIKKSKITQTYPAVTFIAFVLTVPLLFSDRPLRMISYMAVFVIIFCIIVAHIKEEIIALQDIVNAVLFGVLSGVLSTYMMNVICMQIKKNSIGRRAEAYAEADVTAYFCKHEKNRVLMGSVFSWRRHPDLNWGIKVLQTSALPLGYVAGLARVAGFEPAHDGIRIRCLTAWRYPNNFKWGG